MHAIALTIAGSDSSGGAGIQADLKTFSAFGVYGASVHHGAHRAEHARRARRRDGAAGFVRRRCDAVLGDLDVGAIKTGMLANAEIVGGRRRCAAAAAPRRWWSIR